MRLWHEDLISELPRRQLLGQHRECCALRGKGWGKPHATVNYVFTHSPGLLVAYHYRVMSEMMRRGYFVDTNWLYVRYRGKHCSPYTLKDCEGWNCFHMFLYAKPIYPEHDDSYLRECLDNLRKKGIVIDGYENF